MWETLEAASARTKRDLPRGDQDALPEQYYVLIECEDEPQQRELLARFHEEGLKCQAKMS